MGEILKNLTPDRHVTLCNLICLPYAGGGARVFRDWPRHLSRLVNVYAVQLPGREDRVAEPAEADAERVVSALVEAIAPLADEKTVLFGHSLGATLAARVGQELFGDRSESDAVLFVSGRRSPWSGPLRSSARGLSDAELLSRLASVSGLHAQLAADPAFAQMMLPALKADLHLSDAAQGIRERGVPIPVIGLYGSQDEGTPLSYVRQWSRFTTGRFRSVEIDGDHFFLEPNVERVTAIVDTAARSLMGL
ncbi:thioesterase II family protein [Streptomyces parvus]|uniref:thioesterase II family protein n=1 Tax=Streptomyces parvus TaxID=66428 RepID=UPI0035D88411